MVRYAVAGTATSGTDYTSIPVTVTIPAGQLSTTINVGVLGDNRIEGSETVALTLTGIDSGDPRLLIDSANSAATLAIADSETGLVSIAATTAGSETGPASAVFTVTQGGIASVNTVVNLTPSGTASAGTDYTTPPLTVTIPAGQTNATVTVPVNNDTVVESNETLIVTISLGSHDPLVTLDAAHAQATGSILDNDAAQVSIAAAANASESGPAAGRFTVTQSAPSSVDTTVSYTVGGTASGTDFAPLSGSVVIPAGQVSAEVTVTVSDDAIVEATETVALQITGVAGAALVTVNSAQSTASLDIADNDSALVSIALQSAGREAGPAAGSFLVSLTNPSSTATTITLHANGTATTGDDYSALPSSVTIPAGSLSAAISVAVLDDNRFEGAETVVVMLDAVSAGDPQISLNSAAGAATLTISDNETGLLRISKTTDGSETGPANGRFTVTQGGTTTSPTVVTLLVNGSSTAGNDYGSLPATVTIPAGTVSATIDVTVQDDSLVEGIENVRVTLSGIQSGQSGLAIDQASRVATLDIADNDVAQVSIELTTNAAEAGAAAGSFTVRLDRAVAVDTVVSYTVGGTATAGDFVALPAAVTIPAGQTSATVLLTPVDDAVVEANETVLVTLTSTTPAGPSVTIDSAHNAATLEIADNDSAQASIAATTGASESGTVHGLFTVTITAASSTATTISYSVGGTAAGGDFVALPGSVIIPAGATSATIDVTPVDDLAVEGTETILVTLTTLAGDPQITVNSAASSATLQIADNDSATIAFAAAASTAIEPSLSHTLLVRLTLPAGGELQRAVTVNLSDLGTGTATAADYSLTTTSVTFAAGSRNGDTRTVTLSLANDGVTEPDETVRLALAIGTDGTGGRTSVGSPAQHVVTISDDPLTGSLAGVVWVDASGNGSLDGAEATLKGVTIQLSGTSRSGQAVSRSTTTDNLGAYRFANLPAGTYTIVERHPVALLDGAESLGKVGGLASGVAGSDRFTSVVLAPAQSGSGYNFGEASLAAQYVTARFFLASTLAQNQMLRDIVVRTERAVTPAATALVASLPAPTTGVAGEGLPALAEVASSVRANLAAAALAEGESAEFIPFVGPLPASAVLPTLSTAAASARPTRPVLLVYGPAPAAIDLVLQDEDWLRRLLGR